MIKIVCLGDSFTKGLGANRGKDWVSLLNSDSIAFINKGINGDTTSGMLARFYNDVIPESANYVLITGGTNDFVSGSSPETVQNNIMALVHQAYHNNVFPIIGISPDLSLQSIRRNWAEFVDFSEIRKKQDVLRHWIYRFCATFNTPYINFYTGFKSVVSKYPDVNFYVDGLHLNTEGQKHIADIASQFIEKYI